MVATCPTCKKQLKVRDELIGKKLRCPGCGGTFEAGAAAGGGAQRRAGTRFDPKTSKAPAKEKGAGVAISWGPIIGIGAVVLLVLGIVAFIFGPVKMKNKWEEIGGKARDDVEEVVSKGLQCHMSANGGWNPRKGSPPRALDETVFVWQMFVMSMPEKVFFKGATSEGAFSGYYYPSDGKVEAEVGLGGMSLAGLGAVREGKEKLQVVGSYGGGEAQVTVNGKPGVIVYPPKDEDE